MTPSDGFPYYISLTQGQSYVSLFKSTNNIQLFNSISEVKAGFRYANDKWSLKQILGHIIDHERIMTYRALRFSRKDLTLLPGYDQDLLVMNANFDQHAFSELLHDYQSTRSATNSFISLLSEEQTKLKGIAWKFELSVEETLRATIGHELHHLKIIKERYI